MDQPVQDAVGDGGIADLRMPTVDRQLTGQHRRTPAIAVIADLQEAATLVVAQQHHGEVTRMLTQIERILSINKTEIVSVAIVEAARDSLVIGQT